MEAGYLGICTFIGFFFLSIFFSLFFSSFPSIPAFALPLPVSTERANVSPSLLDV